MSSVPLRLEISRWQILVDALRRRFPQTNVSTPLIAQLWVLLVSTSVVVFLGPLVYAAIEFFDGVLVVSPPLTLMTMAGAIGLATALRALRGPL